MAQFARPDSNITQTGFTNGFSAIDESVASDADFAYGANGGANTLEVGLSNVTDPASSTGHIVRYRLAKVNNGALNNTGNAVTVDVGLYQGATLIHAATGISVSSTWTAGSFTLSAAEANAITDYTDLRIRVTDSSNGGSPSGRRAGAISWAELEVPDAPAGVPGTGSQGTLLTSASSILAATSMGKGLNISALLNVAGSLFAASATGGAGGGGSATVARRQYDFGQNVGGATSVTANWPVTPTEGDLMVAGMSIRGTPVITPPAGWVEDTAAATSYPGPTGTPDMTMRVYTKVAGASEPTTVTFTFDVSVKAVLAVYEMFSSDGSAISRDTVTTATGQLATVSASTGARASGDEAIVAFVGQSHIEDATIGGDGFTEIEHQETSFDTNNTRSTLYLAELITAADSTSKTITYTQTAFNHFWNVALLSYKAAGGVGGGSTATASLLTADTSAFAATGAGKAQTMAGAMSLIASVLDASTHVGSPTGALYRDGTLTYRNTGKNYYGLDATGGTRGNASANLLVTASSLLSSSVAGQAKTLSSLLSTAASLLGAVSNGQANASAAQVSLDSSAFDPIGTGQARAVGGLSALIASSFGATSTGKGQANAGPASLTASAQTASSKGAALTNPSLMSLVMDQLVADVTAGAKPSVGLLGTGSSVMASSSKGAGLTTVALVSVPVMLLDASAQASSGARATLLVTTTGLLTPDVLAGAVTTAGMQAVGVTALEAGANGVARALASLQTIMGTQFTVDATGAAEAAASLNALSASLSAVSVSGASSATASLLSAAGAVLGAQARGSGQISSDLSTSALSVFIAAASGVARATANTMSASISVFQPNVRAGDSALAGADLLTLSVDALDPNVSGAADIGAGLMGLAWTVNDAVTQAGAAGSAHAGLLDLGVTPLAVTADGKAIAMPGMLGINTETTDASVTAGARIEGGLTVAEWQQFAASVSGAAQGIAVASLMTLSTVLQVAGATGKGLGLAGIATLLSDILDVSLKSGALIESDQLTVGVQLLSPTAFENRVAFVGTGSVSLSLVAEGLVDGLPADDKSALSLTASPGTTLG